MFHIQMWVLVGTWGGVMGWSDMRGQLDMSRLSDIWGRRLPVDCKLIRHYGSLRWEELNTKETIKRKKHWNQQKLIKYWNFLSSEKYSILFHWNLQQLHCFWYRQVAYSYHRKVSIVSISYRIQLLSWLILAPHY